MFSQVFLQDPLNFLSMWQVVRRMFFCKMRAFLVLACCGIGFATVHNACRAKTVGCSICSAATLRRASGANKP